MPDLGPLVRTDGIPLGQSVFGADALGGELQLWGSQDLRGDDSIVAINSGVDLEGDRLGDIYLGHARNEDAMGGQIFMAAGNPGLGRADGFLRLGDFNQTLGDAAILSVAGAVSLGTINPEIDSRLTVSGGTTYLLNDPVQLRLGDPDDGRLEFFDDSANDYTGFAYIADNDLHLEAAAGDLIFEADSIVVDALASFLELLLLPSYTNAQVTGLTPAEGMFLYNSTQKSLVYYDGDGWREVVTRPLP